MDVGIGTVSGQFLFWEYLFRIFGVVSLQRGEENPARVFAIMSDEITYLSGQLSFHPGEISRKHFHC
jgi:hypothetical protein